MVLQVQLLDLFPQLVIRFSSCNFEHLKRVWTMSQFSTVENASKGKIFQQIFIFIIFNVGQMLMDTRGIVKSEKILWKFCSVNHFFYSLKNGRRFFFWFSSEKFIKSKDPFNVFIFLKNRKIEFSIERSKISGKWSLRSLKFVILPNPPRPSSFIPIRRHAWTAFWGKRSAPMKIKFSTNALKINYKRFIKNLTKKSFHFLTEMKLMNEFCSVSRSLIYFNALRAIFMLENKILFMCVEQKKRKKIEKTLKCKQKIF